MTGDSLPYTIHLLKHSTDMRTYNIDTLVLGSSAPLRLQTLPPTTQPTYPLLPAVILRQPEDSSSLDNDTFAIDPATTSEETTDSTVVPPDTTDTTDLPPPPRSDEELPTFTFTESKDGSAADR